MVEELVDGFVAAHDPIIRRTGRRSIARIDAPVKGKVGIVVGGGSGHLPAFAGYVGKGMADAAAFGNIFASPPAKPIIEASLAVHSGAGLLYTYGNYQGDCINFDKAMAHCRSLGIPVEKVVLNDDVLSAPLHEAEKRRGIAGLFLVWQVAGAKAESMASLEEVVHVTQKAADNTRSAGIGLTSCTVPAFGQPTFSLAENEIEIGLGIHGEPGIRRSTLRPVNALVDEIMEAIRSEVDFAGEDIALLINGLGGSPLEELYVVYQHVASICRKNHTRIRFKHVGEQVTALEMAGFSISIMRLDAELHDLITGNQIDTCLYKKIRGT